MDETGRGEGWLLFAGIVLMIAGVMRFFDAIWAWSYSGPLPSNLQSALLGHSLTTYGWVWLIIAIILFVAGLGVIVRSQFARWFGIVAAGLGAISAVWWMPYYPIWSFTYIVIAMFVIYALSAYGGREPAL
jgi:hypothetical protein